MTDGIIQKAFNNNIRKYNDNSDKNFVSWILTKTQQELIEEIKKHCKEHGNANFIMMYSLIGDNQ